VWRTAALAFAGLALAGCGSTRAHPARPRAPVTPSLELSSSFASGAVIPRVYTCDGQDLSPPLRVSGVPAATVELAVVLRDHDAPGGDFIHWAMARINPRVVASGGAGSATLGAGRVPAGVALGRNSFGSLGYRGPCPPQGDPPHHYDITVFALGRASKLGTGFSAGVFASLDVLALGRLTGTYARR
jgi:Raf kinase inhibitor-like YbhB/YbcL family protein